MYYEEKMIDRVLCWRNNPDSEFTPYTIEQLSRKYEQEKEQTACLREIEDQLRAQLARYHHVVGPIAGDRHKQIKADAEVLRCAEEWTYSTQCKTYGLPAEKLIGAVRAAREAKNNE